MLAARLNAPGDGIRLDELPIPEPRGTEVRVRVAGCGVCRTDLHIVDGTQSRVSLPLTLGHEVAGWLDAVGPDAAEALSRHRVVVGDPVLVYGGWGCGVCHECTADAEQRCARSRAPGFQTDGGYAEQMLVPHPRHLVALGSLDPVRAAPLADAGVTPYRAVRRAAPWLRAGARVLLIGCGGLGQFALQHLRLVPPGNPELVVAVIERDPRRLEQATALGADVAMLDGDAAGVTGALGGRANVVFDLVGSGDTLDLAAQAVAPGGLVMLVGEAGGSLPFRFDHPPVESWLSSVAWGSADDLREVVRLAAGGALRWSVETLPLRMANAAHERLRAGDVGGRLVLVP